MMLDNIYCWPGHYVEHHRPAAGVRREGRGGPGPVRKVQSGARQGGSVQHHESHFSEELQRVHQVYHSATLLFIKGKTSK